MKVSKLKRFYYQTDGITPPPPSPIVIGDLFARDYASGNYSITGGMTTVYNPASISVSGGTSTFDKHTRWNQNIFNCENFTLPFSINVDSAGIAPTIFLNGVGSTNIIFYIILGAGELVINAGSQFSSTDFIGACSTNDVINCSINVVGNVVTFAANNITTGSGVKTVSLTFNFNYPTLAYYPGSSKIAFGTYSGSYTYTWSPPTTTDETNCDLYIFGTSKPKGYVSGGATITTRVSGLWQAANPTKKIINHSGASEFTNNMVDQLYLITKYMPKRVLLMDISNDERFGLLTTVANLTAIRNHVVNTLGIPIFIQNPVPEYVPNGGADLTPLIAKIASVFASGEIIAAPPTWAAATDNAADGVHWINQSKIYNEQAAVITI